MDVLRPEVGKNRHWSELYSTKRISVSLSKTLKIRLTSKLEKEECATKTKISRPSLHKPRRITSSVHLALAQHSLTVLFLERLCVGKAPEGMVMDNVTF